MFIVVCFRTVLPECQLSVTCLVNYSTCHLFSQYKSRTVCSYARGEEVRLHSFLTSALDGRNCRASSSDLLIPGKGNASNQ